MSGGMVGSPMTPVDIGDYIDRLERRLNEAEARERGTGRRAWSGGAQMLVSGSAEFDGGDIAWRKLNDGRIELRGRMTFPGTVANGTRILRLPGLCAPLGNGTTMRAWVTTLAPCSTVGSNPGVIRVDVERALFPEQYDDAGISKTQQVVYADIIVRPPEATPLSGWICFDHVIYDPDLYLDVLEPVPAADHPVVFGRGSEVEPNKWAIRDPLPAEFGIAVLGMEGDNPIITVPGLQAPNQPTPL